MLSNHTHGRLAALGLAGMAKAFDDRQRQPDVTALTVEHRLGLMIDREATERENKRLIVRLKFASLRQTAIVEDVDPIPRAGNDTPAAFLGTGGHLRTECMVAFNRHPWPQSPESALA